MKNVMCSCESTKIGVTGSALSASSDDGNVAANAVDGNLTTRWSASGDGQWLRIDLGTKSTVAYLKMAFLNGDTRTSSFDIQTSQDDIAYTTIQANVTSSLTTGLQTFDFTDATLSRYVRIVGQRFRAKKRYRTAYCLSGR